MGKAACNSVRCLRREGQVTLIRLEGAEGLGGEGAGGRGRSVKEKSE